MPTMINCPSCERKLRVPEELLGKKVRCPSCGTMFTGGGTNGDGPAEMPPSGAPQVPADAGAGLPAPPPPADVGVVPDLALDAPAAVPEGIEPARKEPAKPEPGDEPRPEKWPCPYCGERIPSEAELCPFCGEDVSEDERPWEVRRGPPVRRDCDPHRGSMILVLGITSIVLAPMSVCCYGIPSLIGLGLGIPAWVMGRRDQAKMDTGSMDPEGRGLTQGGMICGIVGTILNSLGILFGLLLLGYVIFVFSVMTKMPPPTRPPRVAPVPPPVAPPAKPKGFQGGMSLRLLDYLPRGGVVWVQRD
jgi:predicted Zn finger-like uncharacterized protein